MQEKVQPKKQHVQQKPGELFFLIILFAIVGAFLVEAVKLKGVVQNSFNGPGTIPQLIAFSMIMMIMAQGSMILKRGPRGTEAGGILQYIFSKNVIALLIMVGLYAFLLEILHFEVTTLVFLFVLMYFFDKRRPLQKLLVSLGTVGFIILVFGYLFEVFYLNWTEG